MCVVFLHMDHAKGNITFNFHFIETDNLDKQQTQKCQKQLTVQLQNCSFRYMMCKLLHPVFPEDKRHLSIDNSSSTGNQLFVFFVFFFPYGDAVTTGETHRNKQHVQIMRTWCHQCQRFCEVRLGTIF